MTKRQQREYTQRKDLQRAGWNIQKRDAVAFNGGSETLEHACLKMVVAKLLRDRGYRISSEVLHDTHGEIDVLAYAGDGQPFAVELETNPTEETVSSKLERYVFSNDVIRECFILPVEDAPDTFGEAYEWVEGKLF